MKADEINEDLLRISFVRALPFFKKKNAQVAEIAQRPGQPICCQILASWALPPPKLFWVINNAA